MMNITVHKSHSTVLTSYAVQSDNVLRDRDWWNLLNKTCTGVKIAFIHLVVQVHDRTRSDIMLE